MELESGRLFSRAAFRFRLTCDDRNDNAGHGEPRREQEGAVSRDPAEAADKDLITGPYPNTGESVGRSEAVQNGVSFPEDLDLPEITLFSGPAGRCHRSSEGYHGIDGIESWRGYLTEDIDSAKWYEFDRGIPKLISKLLQKCSVQVIPGPMCYGTSPDHWEDHGAGGVNEEVTTEVGLSPNGDAHEISWEELQFVRGHRVLRPDSRRHARR